MRGSGSAAKTPPVPTELTAATLPGGVVGTAIALPIGAALLAMVGSVAARISSAPNVPAIGEGEPLGLASTLVLGRVTQRVEEPPAKRIGRRLVASLELSREMLVALDKLVGRVVCRRERHLRGIQEGSVGIEASVDG